MNMNLDHARGGIARPPGWRMAFAAVLAAALLSMAGVQAGVARGATGGLPGPGGGGFDPGGDHDGNHCLTPEGVDVNELLGMSEFMMAPWFPCFAVPAGEFWVPFFSSAWNLNASWEVVPADYTPSAPTPLEDFLSKVRSMTFILDEGTAHERSYRFAAEDVLDVRSVRDFFPSAPDVPTVLFLAKLPPLSPGEHRVAVAIEMSARHCDGLGTSTVFPQNCVDAGTTRLGFCPFLVVPRSPASQPTAD